MVRNMLYAGSILIAATVLSAAPYKELTPKFDRTKSRTMIRKIEKPTLANMDYAAYIDNPVLHDPKKQRPKKPDGKKSLADMTFDGVFMDAVNTLEETPLTDEEKTRPLAWKPLNDRLWKATKDPAFANLTSEIDGEKWADRNVVKPYQEIVEVYLHERDGEIDFWGKVEFKPWVKFLDGINDEDDDDFREIYGRLKFQNLPDSTRQKAVDFIRGDYTQKELNAGEIKDWIMVLASYWYPTYNTDVIDMSGHDTWPTENTNRRATRKLKGLTVQNPVAVVKGNPFGKIIYNVYVVEGLETEKKETTASTTIENKKMDTSVSEQFKANNERFEQERKEMGGYKEWAEKLSPVIEAEKAFLEELPEGQMGFKGEDDWVFFRKSLEMMSAGDLSKQPKDKNPIPHLVDLKEYLAKNDVNLLFVPIPNKEDVYYEHLPFETVDETDAMINPHYRKFLDDVQDAGVEVVDVLPLMLEAKAEDKFHQENLYQRQDTHYTNRGLQIVAKAIADRVKAYSWYDSAAEDKVDYTVRDTTFSRQGDIVARLPEEDKAAYPAVQLKAKRVFTPEGEPYDGDRNDPILLMGDSFTGVFELVDCKNAGLGSHMAHKTGLPVDIVTSWGGGPLVRRKMLRARKDDLGAKRVVVYVMVARDLYNYSQGWKELKVK